MTTFERIKKLAEKRGKNLKTVATDLGFSENALYKWKNQSPTTDNLTKVADYFGVSLDYLVGREVEQQELDDRSELIAAHIDDNVTDEEMEDIIKYINYIKSLHGK